MRSAIYTGVVRHHRLLPVEHKFSYRHSLFLLDLEELDQVFRRTWLASNERWNWISFRRKDHSGDSTQPLHQSIRALVKRETGEQHDGSCFLLTSPRHFGFAMNPVSFYFCYDRAQQLRTIIGEVNNTPWGEQHCYVLPVKTPDARIHHFVFDKQFHVSPFMPMNQEYSWRISAPDSRFVVNMQNIEANEKKFSATMALQRKPLTNWSVIGNLLRHPFTTGKVFSSIYWNAMKLYLKKTPFFAHPKKQKTEYASRPSE